MSQLPLRQLRLRPFKNSDLTNLVGSRGEIYFDSTLGTLKVYNDAAGTTLLKDDLSNIKSTALNKSVNFGTGTLTASQFVGNLNGNITGNTSGTHSGPVIGNATTATTLQTPRNINGVSFNGSADITIETAGSTTSASPPQDPSAGDIWFHSNTGIQYIYTGSQWVQPFSSTTGQDLSDFALKTNPTFTGLMTVNATTDFNGTVQFDNSVTFNNTVSGLTKNSVGLGNVTNESKITMFNSPVFTGIPLGPTPTPGLNNTQIATTAFVQTAISSLINSAPGALDTLNELANAINDDANFASTVTVALSGKEPTIAAGTTAQYYRGDKSFQTLNAAAVGLGNVTNESKATMFTSPTFTTSIDGSNTMTAFASSSVLTIGYSGTAFSSQTDISTAAVTGFNIKTINIGTGATGIASTNINIGAAANTTTTITGIVNVGTIRYSTRTGDLTVTGSYTLDCALYDNWAFTVTGATSLSFSNSPASGRRYTATLIITQAAGGGGSIAAFPSGTVWPGGVAPTLTATASRTDIFTLTTVDGGTKWFGSVIGQNWA